MGVARFSKIVCSAHFVDGALSAKHVLVAISNVSRCVYLCSVPTCSGAGQWPAGPLLSFANLPSATVDPKVLLPTAPERGALIRQTSKSLSIAAHHVL